MNTYRQRIADSLLNFKLHSKGAVLIEGPKWCGKTTTALQIAKSSILMQAKDNLDMNTNSSQWFLVFDHNGQMTVIDISDEETICDEFFQLILIWFKGNKTVKIQKQQNFFQKFKSKLYGSGN